MFKRQKPTTPTAGHGCYPPTVLRKKPAVAEKSDGDVVESNVNFFAADLPYDVKERRVVEHRLRTPHRRFSSGDMKKVIQHWVDLPVGKLLWRVCKGSSVVVNARSNGIMKTVSKVVTKAQKEKEAKECTNLRALIVPDLDEDEGKTMLKRITLIAAGSDGCVSAYGGCVPTSRCLTTKGCVAALAELVKEQSGADLTPYDWVKVTEVHYTDSPNTIFFAPILKASPSPVFSPQVEAGVDGQPDQYVVTPLKLPLASIAEFQVSPSTPKDTLELCLIADALDEWAKRDTTEHILEVLQSRGEECRKKTGLDKVRSERMGQKKRKRDEEVAERKQRRLERDIAMKGEWAEEDEGKTDEQKRKAMLERQKVLRELRQNDTEEDDAGEKQWAKDDQSDSHATKHVVHQRQFESFQYFDPLGTNSLPRLRLQNLLLCAKDAPTLDEVNTLLGLAYIPRCQDYIPYRRLCSDTVELEKPNA